VKNIVNQEKLFKFVEDLIKGHPYKIIINGDFSEKYVEITDGAGGTYIDFEYNKFNEKTLKTELIDNIRDGSMACFEEYKALADLLLKPLEMHSPSKLIVKKTVKTNDELLWEKVWDMFEAVPYYDRFEEKDKLIKKLKNKFRIIGKKVS